MKAIRYTLYAIAGLVVLLVLGGAIFAMTFDPNRYKGEIERVVKERTGRTLALSGKLELAFWPALGAKVAGVTLSERASNRQFLALDSAHASIALLPLLRGQAIVDGIRVSGLKANIVKEKDGRFNFSDLLEAKPEEAGKAQPQKAAKPGPKADKTDKGAVGFDIGSVQIDRSSVSYVDKASGQELALSDLKLATGRIAERGTLELKAAVKGRNPDLDIKVEVGGGYHFDLAAKSFAVSKLDARVTGAAAGVSNLSLGAKGEVAANLEKQTANADLSAKFDESNIQAKLGLEKFSPPSYQFDVTVDRLNLDRYSPPEKRAVATPQAPSGKGAEKPTATPAPQKQAEDSPVDLSALKGLNANGRLQLGALQVKGLKLANVKAEVHAANGRLDVAPHSAKLYDGAMSGAISATADGRVAVKETLNGVSIGPLLRDFAQKDALEGHGSLALDVTAAGRTVSTMKKSLAGNARVQLKDGAIKGINLAEVFRKAKAALASQEARAEARQAQQTDFSEMTASFTIKNGVAHNEDLDMKAPLFRVSGKGDIDIGNSAIDYVTKATVVATTQGQGGADLAQLSGLSVPVHLTGPLDAMKYQVDYSAVASQLVKSKAADKLRGLLGR